MKIDVKIPAIGESVTEATVANWLKENGEYADEDEVICEVESEKATIEVVAEKAGVLTLKVEEGQVVGIGDVIAQIDTEAEAETTDKEQKEESEEKKAKIDKEEEATAPDKEDLEEKVESKNASGNGKQTKISPLASNILQKAGIKPSEVSGSGSGGKITKADALKAVEKGSGKSQDEPKSQPQIEKISGERAERREKMTTLRKTIARRLLESKHGTAMLTTFNEIDLLKVKELRAQYKDMFKEKHGVGLGFMSFFTKACSIALQEIPQVNAMIDGDEMVYHDYADIGIAVSTDKGLVVPIIRNAEKLSLHEIELEIVRLATKARDGKLSIDEMTGGTFTITNGGVFGSMLSTPIINVPQSAILGMHNIIERPVAVDGQVVIRPMMYVAMSYDHRIIDGKESVTFVKRVKELLEDPARIILEV